MDDRRRDEGTNSTLRTKERGTHLTLNEHDDDDDDAYFVPRIRDSTSENITEKHKYFYS